MRSLVKLRSKLDVFRHGGDQVLDDTRLGRVDSSVKRGHLGVELRFETSIHLHFISSLLIDEKDAVSILCFVSSPRRSLVSFVSHLVHHRGVPRLSLRPIRRDLNLRLLDRRAQSRRLLCARDRVHASHVSHRARRSIHDVLHSIAQSFIHSFIHALARRRPHAPSLAAPTMACASFSAIMSLEIPSARVASMIARSNARRLRLPSRVSSLAVVADPRGFPFLHETVRDDGVRTPSNAGAREEGGGVSTHTRTHRRITIRKQPPPSHPRCLTSIAGRPSLGARARRPRRHSTTTKMFASTTSATTTMFASGGSVSAKFRATAAPARAPTRVVIESA